MRLLAEKAPCPWCGRKVKEPSDPSDYLCPYCGKPGPWASPDRRAEWKTKQSALDRYQASVERMLSDDDPVVAASELKSIIAGANLSPRDVAEIGQRAYARFAESATADDILTPEESIPSCSASRRKPSRLTSSGRSACLRSTGAPSLKSANHT
jgi:hypothetical protein